MHLKSISKEGYSNIFYNSQAAMLIIDTDAPAYTMLDVNNAYLEATNTTRADLIGKPVFGVFPGNPTDDVSKNIERTIFSFEQAIQHKKPHVMSNYRYDIPIPGTTEFEERYWTTSNTPVLDDNGDVLYFIHSPANVTELNNLALREKAGIEALKEQREQLYSIFMQAPVGITILKGKDNVVDLANPPICELWGRSLEQLLGKPIFQALPQARDRGFEELMESVRTTGVPFKGVGLPVSVVRNGEVKQIYVNFVYEPFRETDGSISGVIAVAIEVTDEIDAKSKIEEAEERARVAVEAADLGTFDLDLLSAEMITSKKFANIFGFDQPVARRAYVKVFHEDDLGIRISAHEKAVVNGRLLYEARVKWKDESIHWVKVEGKVFYDTEGNAVRIRGILMDITEQKNLQRQKDDFIGMASHELKTPVTSIKGYAQVLEKMLQDKGDRREAEMMNRLDTQVNRLTSLIGDLLDVTKVNAGKLQFNDHDFEFIPMLKELVEDLQRTTTTHTLFEEYDTVAGCMVHGDKERIGQVITNFISNAIKYSPRANKIIVHAAIKNNELHFCVEDFGIGIPKDNLEKVFEQFYRVSGDTLHTFPGLGLGLYISAEIIKREGGRIWVNSEPGKGSCFCFALAIR